MFLLRRNYLAWYWGRLSWLEHDIAGSGQDNRPRHNVKDDGALTVPVLVHGEADVLPLVFAGDADNVEDGGGLVLRRGDETARVLAATMLEQDGRSRNAFSKRMISNCKEIRYVFYPCWFVPLSNEIDSSS